MTLVGNLTSLELGTGATLNVGDLVLVGEHLNEEEDGAAIEADPHKVDEIWFDDDEEPSGHAIVYLEHFTIEDADRVDVSPQDITNWMDEGKAFIGTPE